jgi:hypothetical protein
VPPVVIVDNALSSAALDALADGALSSRFFGESTLEGTFMATRGFAVTFHRGARGEVEARFPFLQPYFALALDDDAVARVRPRGLFFTPPPANAFFANVLMVPPGAAVERHVDATLGPKDGSIVPVAVSVLYVSLPPDLKGGELVLSDEGRVVDVVEPRRGRLLWFAGHLAHEVRPVDASAPRLSWVIEQYLLDRAALARTPRFRVHSKAGFRAYLEDVQQRRR